MNQLLSILEDNSGGLSSLRVIVLAWALGILVVWVACSIQSGAAQPIPESVVVLFSAGVAGKVAQRGLEKSEPINEK